MIEVLVIYNRYAKRNRLSTRSPHLYKIPLYDFVNYSFVVYSAAIIICSQNKKELLARKNPAGIYTNWFSAFLMPCVHCDPINE